MNPPPPPGRGAGSLVALLGAAAALAAFLATGETERAPTAAVHDDGSLDDGPVGPRAATSFGPARSRFFGRIVDVHTHLHPATLEPALALLDERGVRLAVNLLPIPFGDAWPVVQDMERRAGGRLVHFVSPDWQQLLSRPEGFGEAMAENLARAVGAGARGLKIAKGLGLGLPAPEGGLLAVDDPRLDPLWSRAGELGVPVAIHVGDPVAFWQPATPDNERYDELKENPGWSNFGRDLPSHAELMAAQRRLFARHPRTRFLAVHVAGNAEDLAWVDALLDELPNVSIDLAARLPELGHHPAAEVRRFLVKHQDRVLFGTDLGVSPSGLMLGAPLAWREGPDDVERFYAATWRYLETADRGFAHPTPIQGRWTIDGLDLPDAVLEKIYFRNAERLLGLAAP